MNLTGRFQIVASGCHIWTGARKGKDGRYGSLNNVYAHRLAWELEHGPIPPRAQIHHLCGNKLCIRVDHLECVTPREHAVRHRRDVCRNGHDLSNENVRISRSGKRVCLRCETNTRRRHSNWQGGIANREKTHCIHGHPLEGGNLRIDKDGRRTCRACVRARHKKWLLKKRGMPEYSK